MVPLLCEPPFLQLLFFFLNSESSRYPEWLGTELKLEHLRQDTGPQLKIIFKTLDELGCGNKCTSQTINPIKHCGESMLMVNFTVATLDRLEKNVFYATN